MSHRYPSPDTRYPKSRKKWSSIRTAPKENGHTPLAPTNSLSHKWDQTGFMSAATAAENDVGGSGKNLIKVVVIGESGAGKSNLIQRLIANRFDLRSKSTIGIDFALYPFVEPNDIRVLSKVTTTSSKLSKNTPQVYKAQIWDTAGQERYRSSMTRIFYRDVAGALLVYDITNRDHFRALNRWLNEIRTNVHSTSGNQQTIETDQIPIVLVGNKVDQAAKYREVDIDEAMQFVRTNRLADHVETSAKTGINVELAFMQLFRAILTQRIHAEEQMLEAKRKSTKGKFKSKGSQHKKLQRDTSFKLSSVDRTYGQSQYASSCPSSPPQYRKKSNKCSC